MITPKRRYPRPIQRVHKPAPRYCANPKCGAKITKRENRLYCDKTCRAEHEALLKLERRPKEVRCAFCTKPLDILSRGPREWRQTDRHFCDQICADAYRREHGHYQAASKRGIAAIQEYKKRHGRAQDAAERGARTSANNRKAPPKAKHFERHGRVWGYDVHFYPDETGYRASVPELIDELGIIHCKTVKEGLRAIRQKIVAQRQEASRE